MFSIRSTRVRGAAALFLAGTTLFAGTACSSSDDAPSKSKSTTSAPATATTETTTKPADTPTTKPTDSNGGTGGPGEKDANSAANDGKVAAWARPFQTPGDKITTIEGTGFKVDVYQVGTAKAASNGAFVDPETSEPILKKGDELVVVNYVFTNTGSEPILLSSLLVDVNARYADWKWMQSMDSVTDPDLFEQMGILSDTLASDAGKMPYTWEPGTSFAAGDSFAYQSGDAITFEASLTPADAKGELVQDQSQEVKAETKIN